MPPHSLNTPHARRICQENTYKKMCEVNKVLSPPPDYSWSTSVKCGGVANSGTGMFATGIGEKIQVTTWVARKSESRKEPGD